MERSKAKWLELPIVSRFSFLVVLLVLAVFLSVLGVPYIAKDQTSGINKHPMQEPKLPSGEAMVQNLDALYQDQISAKPDQNLDDFYPDLLPLNSPTT